MEASNEKQIAQALVAALELFPQHKLSTRGIGMYVTILNDLPADVVKAALVKRLRTARFFPAPSEIRDAAKELLDEVEGTRAKDADEAWREVMDNVRKRGVYKPWEYSSHAVEAAARAIGIEQLCLLEMSEVNTARAQFRDFYNQAVKRERGRKEALETLKALGFTDGVKRLVSG